MRPVELGRLQPGETVEEHKAAVAAVLNNLPSITASSQAMASALGMAAEQVLAIGRALADALPADPDEPGWFDAMRPDPDAEVWTP